MDVEIAEWHKMANVISNGQATVHTTIGVLLGPKFASSEVALS